ncbi:hypothetical protein V6574_24875 [Streptomyces sp. SM1P]
MLAVHVRDPWPFSFVGGLGRVGDAADLYPNVRVELLVVREAFRSPALAVSGSMVAPAKYRFLQERSVRESMTQGAAACPP